jgi:hypothetical protein
VDLWHNLTKFLDHWRYTVLGGVLAAGLVALAACETTGTNPVTGGQATAAAITRDVDIEAERLTAAAAEADRIYGDSLTTEKHRHEEALAAIASVHRKSTSAIEGELSALGTRYEAALEEIEAKAAKRAAIISLGQQVLGGINPALATALGMGGLLLGGGAVGDKKRTNAVLAKTKKGPASGGAA